MENWKRIGKKLNGELTPEESLRFDKWLNASEANQKAWKDAEKVWKAAGDADTEFDADTESALQKVKAVPVAKSFRKKLVSPAGITAFVVFSAVAAFLVIYFTAAKKPGPLAANRPVTLAPPAVAKEKMRTISAADSAVSFYLPDSSHIYLNKNSSLTYPEKFSGTLRAVTLSGEAFFEVKPGSKAPFVITAGNTETTVTGTSFNIKEDGQTKKVEISVISGYVNVKALKNSDHLGEVTLSPQDRLTYSEKQATMVKQKIKNQDEYWWIKNLGIVRKLFKDAQQGLSKPSRYK